MKTLQENTMEFILNKIDELKKDKQIHSIQIKLIDEQIELLRKMIIRDTI